MSRREEEAVRVEEGGWRAAQRLKTGEERERGVRQGRRGREGWKGNERWEVGGWERGH